MTFSGTWKLNQYTCTIINTEENSSDWKEISLKGVCNLYKGVRSTRKNKYMPQYKRLYIFTSLNDLERQMVVCSRYSDIVRWNNNACRNYICDNSMNKGEVMKLHGCEDPTF